MNKAETKKIALAIRQMYGKVYRVRKGMVERYRSGKWVAVTKVELAHKMFYLIRDNN